MSNYTLRKKEVMPFRTEGLGVDAGLMSFIQDTHRDKFRGVSWSVATRVPVREGDQYLVDVEMRDMNTWGVRAAQLHIKRVIDGGNFIIEKGCENIIISDPCYILGDLHWHKFCNSLYTKEHDHKAYPIFMEHYGVKAAVSGSGFGDGYYNCNIETDDNGNLVEATVTFIGDEEDEDLEEQWDDEDEDEDDN